MSTLASSLPTTFHDINITNESNRATSLYWQSSFRGLLFWFGNLLTQSYWTYQTYQKIMALAKEEKQQTDLVLKLPVVGPPWLYKANRPPFLSVYRRNNLRGMLGEHITNFSSFLPTSQVGYYAAKPIESAVYWSDKYGLTVVIDDRFWPIMALVVSQLRYKIGSDQICSGDLLTLRQQLGEGRDWWETG